MSKIFPILFPFEMFALKKKSPLSKAETQSIHTYTENLRAHLTHQSCAGAAQAPRPKPPCFSFPSKTV